MASISTNQKTGARRILFDNAVGRRQILYVGKVTMRLAETIARRIEDVVTAAIHKQPLDREAALWLSELQPQFRRKLERLGLVTPRAKRMDDLQGLTAGYFATLKVKAATLITYRQTEADLWGHFGKARKLNAITPVEAQTWRAAMEKRGLASATIARRVKTAKRIFLRAVKWKLIEENPFAEVRGGLENNRDRLRFISPDVAAKVLAHCPDAQWRLIFALSRWGGLRCPSEHLSLQWDDVNFEQRKFRVDSTKTGERWVPIFPELMKPFLDAYHEAEEGAKHVIVLRQNARTNLRSGLQRIIRRAGVTAWPKLFHNLRATRQTELAERFPIQAVCGWIGNSEVIARRHYLQVTDEHFEAATMTEAEANARRAQTTRHGAESGGVEGKSGDENRTGAQKTPLHGDGAGCVVTPTGLRIPPKPRGKMGRPDTYDARRDSIPPEVRMEMALAAIGGAFKALCESEAKGKGVRK